MLPYLIAFYGGQLMGDARVAQEFYTIAGMQDDAPSVSQILAVIATAPQDTPKPIARNFTIMAAGAYDTEPFACSELTAKLFHILEAPHITRDDILFVQDAQARLEVPNYANSLGSQTCYDMLDRAIKYTFLAFMNEQSERYPDATDINTLLTRIPLDTVPTTATQSGMSLRYTENGWEYYSVQ